MIHSLRTKWVLTLLLTSLLGVSMVGVFAYRANSQEFDSLVTDQALESYVEQAATFYEQTGNWRSAAAMFDPNRVAGQLGNPNSPGNPPPPPGQGGQPPAQGGQPPAQGRPPQGNMPPPLASNGPDFVIANAERYIVKPALGYGINTQLTDSEMASAAPVIVDDETVGYIFITQNGSRLNEREQSFLQRTSRAIILGMVGATILAMVVGIFVASRLLAPIRELNVAIERMRDGKLHQRIQVRSKDEIGKLGATFNEMSDEIARNQEMRRQMTSDIAHDLRTPLTVIAGYLEALRDGTFTPTEARFTAMYNETQALQFLVTDLNTLSKADNGSLRMNLEDVAPKDLINRVYQAFEVQARTKRITVFQVVNVNLPRVPMDIERMAQVLGNLVSNALRYTPANGGITLTATLANNKLQLQVSDTGSGIIAEKLPYIFERFFRADESRSQIGHESGLGLAIARSLVEAHGGTIKVESEVGEGTTFTIDLPLVATLSQPQYMK